MSPCELVLFIYLFSFGFDSTQPKNINISSGFRFSSVRRIAALFFSVAVCVRAAWIVVLFNFYRAQIISFQVYCLLRFLLECYDISDFQP